MTIIDSWIGLTRLAVTERNKTLFRDQTSRYASLDDLSKNRGERTLPPSNPRTLLVIFMKAAAAAALYQVLKDLAFPGISLIQSQALTVVLVGLVAAAVQFLLVRRTASLLEYRDGSFRLLFYHNPLPMWVFDAETLAFLEVNDAALAHYGYSREEFLSLTALDIRPAEDIPRLKQDLHAPRSGYRDAGVWRHCTRDGRIIWVQITNHLTDWRGRKAVLLVARDVTETRRSEAALRATEELFRTAFEEAPFGMCLTALDGRFLQANGALCEILGYSAQELRGGAWESITHPDDVAPSRQAASQLMANPEVPVELIKRYIPKQGGIIWARLKITTVMDSNQKPSHWIAHIDNITERKQAKEELIRAKEAAEAASRAKSQFLANMSHEIRTPMNAIMGMTELALASAVSEEQRDYLNTVRSSGESLLDIINDILDFSKIEAGRFTLNTTEFDLDHTLQEITQLMAVPAHEKGLELLYENRAELPERIVGDPGRVRQVVVNLLGNAVKFTSSGEVSLAILEAREQGDVLAVHLAVSDTGIGIGPEWRDRIFDPFVQADESNTRRHGGTGLGLAICSRLVDHMGGRMWVESELGRGSVFHCTTTFALPAAPTKRPLPAQSGILRGLNVLVVDPSTNLRRILSEILARWEMEPATAGSMADARDMLREAAASGKPFDAILVDRRMAGPDGLPFTAPVQPEGLVRGRSIVMLRSQDAGFLSPELRSSGNYVMKPVTSTNLLDTLLRALGSPLTRIPPSGSPAFDPPQRPLHILLVEDNAVNQKVGARLVEKLGHSVEIAGDGEQALAAWKRDIFDLILMDVQMPVMNGYDVTRAIRAGEQGTGRHIPIVALTAHAMKDDQQMCLDAGMDGYLAKPIHSRELAASLERWGDHSDKDRAETLLCQ